MQLLIDWIFENPQTRIPILGSLIALFGIVLGAVLNSLVLPWVKLGLEKLWEKAQRKFGKKKSLYEYLDSVIEVHRFLPILPSTLVPVTQVNVQELDNLYVSLAMGSSSKDGASISLGEALKKSSKIVIIGDPGAGKTTMLRFLALNFALAKRKRSLSDNKIQRDKENQRIRESQKRVKEEFGYSDFPLPIFVYLNRLRDVNNWIKGQSLLDTLRDELKASDQLRDLPNNFFEEKLKKGECIFLFDAFDELGTSEAREAIATKIGQLAASASRQGNRFILTSRIIGYDGQLNSYGFSTVKIQKLTESLIKELLSKWYESLQEPRLAEQLLETMKLNPRLYELAVNPMLLSLIALVQYVKRIIPDRRHLLYDECIKILVERRYAPPQVQNSYNEVLPGEDATEILQEIALVMHKEHLREVTRRRLENEIVPHIVKKMPTRPANTLSVDVIIRNIEERSQLLVERGFDESGEFLMAFSHLTFQEYLVSVALIKLISRRGEKTVSSELLNNYKNDPDWWKEVALLYGAQLNNHERKLFMDAIYPIEKI